MPEFLLEIGFEEMPAPWLAGLTDQLRERFAEIAARDHLSPAVVEAWATPRRLVLSADLPGRQPDREEMVFGPSLKVARDAGHWTKAAEGFARKQGATVESLEEAEKGGERYVAFRKRTAGRDAREVLPAGIAAALRALGFPKRMSWDAWLDDGRGAFPFGRPIRWLVALLDGAVVPFAIHELRDGGKGPVLLRSGDRTFGHRFLPRGQAKGALPVSSLDGLKRTLAQHYVLLDPGERAARIARGLADQAGGASVDDHGLSAEWRDLVEYPTVLAGAIPAEFQSLPREVLETVLVHHQKYVPLAADGAVRRFAAVVNGDGSGRDEIVRGMERVVVARLRDAAFFLAEDRKRPLADRVPDLAGVTFHRGLGTYLDKAERMVRLVDVLGEMGALPKAEVDGARQAARLAKADLTTLMVREFPELQGVMGALYLEAEGGHAAGVAAAVRWHYHPVSAEDEGAPRTAVFAAVSLADKLDSLAGYFGLGLVPSGSSDPFGLRRAALGVVRTVVDLWPDGPRPNLRRLAAQAIDGYGGDLRPRPAAEIARDLEGFLLDRLRYVLAARGFAADEVEAVLGAREPDALDDPHEALLRLRALNRVRQEAREDFEHLAVAFKRAKNILGDAAEATVDAQLLSEEAERNLHAAVARQREVDGGYEGRLRALAGLRGPVDRFFDDVLVMAEDPRVRANRLGLLKEALALFYRIADISKLEAR